MPSMPQAKRLRFDIYPDIALRRALDRWRIEQEPPLTRAEAARKLLEEGLARHGYLTAEKAGNAKDKESKSY